MRDAKVSRGNGNPVGTPEVDPSGNSDKRTYIAQIPLSTTSVTHQLVREPVALSAIPWSGIPDDGDPVSTYLTSLARTSARTMASALHQIAAVCGRTVDTMPWPSLGYQDALLIRARLLATRQAASVNVALSALRGVAKASWRLGLADHEGYRRVADVPSVRGNPLPAGRTLSREEMRRLFATCAEDDSPLGCRDGALLGVLYFGGLRRAELCGLDVRDYDAELGELRVRAAKSARQRTVFIERAVLDAWLGVRGCAAGPLFWTCAGRGRALTNRRISGQAVSLILKRRAAQAGLRAVSPHSVRRTTVTHLLDSGADVLVVARMVGHRSPLVTARYDRRGVGAQRHAGALLRLAFTHGRSAPSGSHDGRAMVLTAAVSPPARDSGIG